MLAHDQNCTSNHADRARMVQFTPATLALLLRFTETGWVNDKHEYTENELNCPIWNWIPNPVTLSAFKMQAGYDEAKLMEMEFGNSSK